MSIQVDVVRAWDFQEIQDEYTWKDTVRYALALGYGSDPTDSGQLEYVYEKNLQIVPTIVTTFCHPGFWISDPRTGIDATRSVHVEHKVAFHAPLGVEGHVRAKTRVVDIVDRGRDKGALLVFARDVFDVQSGALLATIEHRSLCRGDGGFDEGAADRQRGLGDSKSGHRPAAAPSERPEFSVDIPTLPQAALMYRLSADPNPLHADPEVAKAAGYPRPILHGLCTYGIAARAIITGACRNKAADLKSLAIKFISPVFPGERIRTDMWMNENVLVYTCTVPQRGVVVAKGIATIDR